MYAKSGRIKLEQQSGMSEENPTHVPYYLTNSQTLVTGYSCRLLEIRKVLVFEKQSVATHANIIALISQPNGNHFSTGRPATK
jgi:hypothetical protein